MQHTSDLSGLLPTERDACAIIGYLNKAGRPTHGNVQRTIEALIKMGHRAGEIDGEGDGCGILTDIPRALCGGSSWRSRPRSRRWPKPRISPSAISWCRGTPSRPIPTCRRKSWSGSGTREPEVLRAAGPVRSEVLSAAARAGRAALLADRPAPRRA